MTCHHPPAGKVTTHPDGYDWVTLPLQSYAMEETCARPECITAALARCRKVSPAARYVADTERLPAVPDA